MYCPRVWRRQQLSFLAVALLLSASSAGAATQTAANCSLTAVSTAVASAVEGDHVLIPAGVCEWAGTLVIGKAITLQGSGIGATIILDSTPGQQPLISWTLVPNRYSRMTGIEFRNGSRAIANAAGIVTVSGSNADQRRMRIDKNKFDHVFGFAIVTATVLGVIDHNQFLYAATNIPVYVYDGEWNSGIYGDGAWAAPTRWGSDQFLFVETNTFVRDVGLGHYAVIDGYKGMRVVFRHNTVYRGVVVVHGTESGGRNRSGRAIEIYDNTFIGDRTGSNIATIRGGTALVYNNSVQQYYNAQIHLVNHRNFADFRPWGPADGTNPWDRNAPGGPFASHVVASSGNLSVTVAGASWTPNQWAGYTVQRTSVGGGHSEILSNTNDTIYYQNSGGYGANLAFSANETFAIWKVEEAMDQPGKSGGALLIGTSPSVPASWFDQVDDPLYEWNNVADGSQDIDFVTNTAIIRNGKHFFNDVVPPKYTAYTYPHPLVALTPPGQPANLRIVAAVP